jgi:hypothetical protein
LKAAIYEFPPLAECRAAFVEKLGQAYEWDEPNEWVLEPASNFNVAF